MKTLDPYDIPQDQTTELEVIRFPLPIRGSLSKMRVQFDRKAEAPKFFYVRLSIGGVHRNLACTTDEAKACRFADMAVCRFRKNTERLKLNYSLEQVALDEQIPEARALLDQLVELYRPIKKLTWDERLKILEDKIDALARAVGAGVN
jgi:hypothetical protein